MPTNDQAAPRRCHHAVSQGAMLANTSLQPCWLAARQGTYPPAASTHHIDRTETVPQCEGSQATRCPPLSARALTSDSTPHHTSPQLPSPTHMHTCGYAPVRSTYLSFCKTAAPHRHRLHRHTMPAPAGRYQPAASPTCRSMQMAFTIACNCSVDPLLADTLCHQLQTPLRHNGTSPTYYCCISPAATGPPRRT